MSQKNYLNQVGVTTDGKAVVAGVYEFYETHGLPLDVLFDSLDQKNQIPCWISFYKSASLAGMKHERILSKLEEAISDVYGKEFTDAVIKKLDGLMK